jgi:hypothetical protein
MALFAAFLERDPGQAVAGAHLMGLDTETTGVVDHAVPMVDERLSEGAGSREVDDKHVCFAFVCFLLSDGR